LITFLDTLITGSGVSASNVCWSLYN